MAKTLVSMFPDPEQILRLDPEEVAWLILEIVQSWEPGRIHQYLNHHNFEDAEAKPYTKLRQEVMDVLSEGWAWLKRECLFVPRAGSYDNVILSRKAKQIITKNQFEAHRRGNLLAGMLHPYIERESKAAFLRGDYGLAVFNAFKQVEVAVREVGGFTWKDLGTDLMNEAFKAHVGRLTDKSLPEPEQLGLRSLFYGAIAYYKNPESHRNVPADPVEVAEILFFASLLLRIVDRAPSLSPSVVSS
jgi:uncharacterized protein (TIGR02391 family)